MPQDQELTIDKLSAGDRPSILALGVAAAESLKQASIAVFMVDVLGRVQILPPNSITVKIPARVKTAELDSLDEASAINIMTAQGDGDDSIVEYLRHREGLGDGNSNL
jgi:hypothetical protein